MQYEFFSIPFPLMIRASSEKTKNKTRLNLGPNLLDIRCFLSSYKARCIQPKEEEGIIQLTWWWFLEKSPAATGAERRKKCGSGRGIDVTFQ